MQGIRKYLEDSYNGLYKIVLEPYMPKRNTVLALIAGLFIGLIFAYAIAPVVFVNGNPSQLGRDWQEEWVKGLAARHAAANSNVDDVIEYLLQQVNSPVQLVNELATEAQTSNDLNLQDQLRGIEPLAQQAEQRGAAPAPAEGNIFSDVIWPWILFPIVVVILFVIVDLLWNILIYPNIVGPFIDSARRGFKPDPAKAEIDRQKELRKLADQAKIDAAERAKTNTRGAPMFTRVSIYQPGRSYDDSFAIETADDVFLGECGATISESVSVGDQKRPSAIEVFIFDKDDPKSTPTAVIAAPGTYNDPAAKSRLELKGDKFAEGSVGSVTTLETMSLVMEIRVSQATFASGTPIPNSAYDSLNIELSVWVRSGEVAGKVAGQSMGAAPAPMAAPVGAAPSFAPGTPAAAPRPAVTPLAPPPMQPLQPPPMQMPGQQRPPADDPFGGTGDFTPIGG